MKRAIISVSDKSGIVDLARKLAKLGIEIVSTGGTAKLLAGEGISVTPIESVTGYPECLDGRVKTLHPNIHGGILAKRDVPEHMQTLQDLDIEPVDLLVINLYPFKETMEKEGVGLDECVENIDIGGPSMLRAAAKNYPDVTCLIDPDDYAPVIAEIEKQGDTRPETRFRLAAKVFAHTAAYDALIAGYLEGQLGDAEKSDKMTLTFERMQSLRYGENPHQKADYYRQVPTPAGSLPLAEQLGGKALSYNNIADTDAALCLLKEFERPTCVAIKHANPCGVGSDDTIIGAWKKAYEADSVSIFGGIVAFNRTVDLSVAKATKGIFLEVFLAPDFTAEALEELQSRKNLRILRLPDAAKPLETGSKIGKSIHGGLLWQDQDLGVWQEENLKVASEKKPPEKLRDDLLFAMKVVKHVKSNGIVLAKGEQTVGIGPGQPNRISSVKIAAEQAGDKAKGSVMASDAFFPFDDCVNAAADAGVCAIIQPGGSIRDQDSIDACNERGLAMLMTGIRHFRH